MGGSKATHRAQYKLQYTNRGWDVSLESIPPGNLRTAFLENLVQLPVAAHTPCGENAKRANGNGKDKQPIEDVWNDVVLAFQHAHKLFLPHLPLGKAAWKTHEDILPECRKEIAPFLDAQGSAIREDNEEEAWQKILEYLKKTSWPMDWYWKAAFQFMYAIGPKDDQYAKLTIKIHQIRQWVLLTIFKADSKRLVAPPMFGRSERLHAWDQYALYLPFFENIATHYAEIKKQVYESSPLHELELGMAFGRHDIEYTVSGFSYSKQDQCYRLTLDAVLELNPYSDTGSFHVTSPYLWHEDGDSKEVAYQLCQPYGLVRFPIFSNPSDKDAHKDQQASLPVLLSSDRYCEALAAMSEVWNDKTAKTVLVIAPPGAGKETLAESTYHFREYKQEDIPEAFRLPVQRRLVSSSLSPGDSRLNEMRLSSVGSMSAYQAFGRSRRPQLDESAGLILQALGGVLFLDEIDKVSTETRIGLLRVLEGDLVEDPKTGEVVSFRPYSPLYVFAGSKPKNEIFALPPIDFWTRISHVIDMAHPLDIADEEQRRLVLREYFQLFWNRHVPAFFGHRNGMKMIPFAETEESFMISGYYFDVFRFLVSRTVTLFLSDCFAAAAMGISPIQILSIRNVRNIARKVCYALFEMLVYPKRYHCRLNVLRRRIFEDKDLPSLGIPWFVLLEFALTPETEDGWVRLMECIKKEHGEDRLPGIDLPNVRKICDSESRNAIRQEIQRVVEKSIRDMLPPFKRVSAASEG